MTAPNYWPINDETAAILDQYLKLEPPTMALDVGAGRSTTIIARHATRTLGLEHNAKYGLQTRKQLTRLPVEIRRTVRLAVVPLVDIVTPDGPAVWYDINLPDGIDFALIDGPPLKHGRGGGLHRIWPHLADDWEIWVDDWNRDHEQTIVANWQRHYPIAVEDVSRTVARILPA